MTPVLDRARRLRTRRRRRRRVRPLVVALCVALLGGVLVWAVCLSSLLSVRTVEVAGASHRTADQVSRLAHRVLGEPLVTVDTEAVRTAVAAIPGVETVRVRRSWPSTLRVVVTVRQGVAVASRKDRLWLVDGHGVLFQRVSVAPDRLPRLDVTAPGPHDPATRAALAAVRAMPESLRATVGSVSAPTVQTVRLALRDGRSVLWGGAHRSEEKARVLAALLRQPGTVYDISTPMVVVVR